MTRKMQLHMLSEYQEPGLSEGLENLPSMVRSLDTTSAQSIDVVNDPKAHVAGTSANTGCPNPIVRRSFAFKF